MRDDTSCGDVLSEAEVDTFARKGVIRLEGFLPLERLHAAKAAVLRVLEREGVWCDGRWLLEEFEASNGPTAGLQLTRGLKRSPALENLATPELLAAIEVLVEGRAFAPLTDQAQVLFTLPNANLWTVPHSIWHLDVPRLPSGKPPGVQLFTFLDSVKPRGGGTLVVAGSHRFLNDEGFVRSKDVKRRLKREPYFADLMSKDMKDRERFVKEPGRVGDIEVQVVELHGEPGDVYLTDLRLLHTLAPNATSMPRMMLTQRFMCEDAVKEMHWAFSRDRTSK